MELLVGIIFGGYCFLLVLFRLAWSKNDPDKRSHDNDLKLSVVIPVRNEANNIQQLLKDLNNQQIKNAYEVIVVDDESEDGTPEKVEDFIRQNDCSIKLIHQHSNGQVLLTPKKRALNRGIDAASGDITRHYRW